MSAAKFKLPTFRGGTLQLLRNHDHEVIVCGGSDIGKTWAACVKSFMLCTDRHRKGVHGCMVRKTYNSIQESGARTFNTITAGIPGITRYGGTTHTERWVFPKNGSELVCVGLDKPDKLLSSEWDFVQVIQAEQLLESDWETIASRCTGRGAVVAYPQIFGDCNPSGSRHWIRERAKAGKLTLINSTHKDNPALYDEAGNILPEGRKRIGILESTLTGVRRKRLLEGIWATAEGAVFDTFDPTVHMVDRPAEEMKKWYLCQDEGYTNPAAILLVGADADDRWHVFKEWYRTGQLQAAVIDQARLWARLPRHCAGGMAEVAARELLAREQIMGSAEHQKYFSEPIALDAVDAAAAGLIAGLLAAGINARGGKGRIIDGIQALQNRLKVMGDGRPRLTIARECVNLQNELESHVWEPDKPKDTPLDKDNHAIAALRYLHDVLAEPDGAFASADGILVGQEDPQVHTPDTLDLGELTRLPDLTQ